MTEHVREAGQKRTPFLAALRRRLWEAPRRRREEERRRKEEQARAEERLPNRLLEASFPMVLLAVLARQDEYGYGIARELEKVGLPRVGGATIYPPLRYLERAGLVDGYVVPQDDGPRRKYYRLLPAGKAALEEYEREWRSAVGAIHALLAPGGER